MTKPIPIRLPEKDLELIDDIVKSKKSLFTNRSDFARFAIEKTIFETMKIEKASEILKRMGKKTSITKKEAERIDKEIHQIRKKLMKRYYK